MNIYMTKFAQAIKSPDGLPQINPDTNTIETALSFFFALTGAIAFLIIILAGFRFVMSRGEPQSVAKAKNTIIYAALGLVISIAAVAIVRFVVGNVTP
jgi:hypothetical protein